MVVLIVMNTIYIVSQNNNYIFFFAIAWRILVNACLAFCSFLIMRFVNNASIIVNWAIRDDIASERKEVSEDKVGKFTVPFSDNLDLTKFVIVMMGTLFSCNVSTISIISFVDPE